MGVEAGLVRVQGAWQQDVLVPSLSWLFLNQYLSHTARPHTGHKTHNEAWRHYIMSPTVTVPGLTDQLWPQPTQHHSCSHIYCTQLYTVMVKGSYQCITGGLGAEHISPGRLPGFSSLHLSHTLILSSLHCFFSLSLHSSLYVSVFPLSPTLLYCLPPSVFVCRQDPRTYGIQ